MNPMGVGSVKCNALLITFGYGKVPPYVFRQKVVGGINDGKTEADIYGDR